MGKFVISTRKNGEFQFNLKATNGQVILSSEGYTTKAACMNGVESVKKNAQTESRFEKHIAKNGKFYFNLKATNGQVIGSSQMYESEASRDNGINSVQKNAPDAAIEDQTLA
ncbi:YegP family protein [Tannerella sp.]|uniref:YegP family protein n=1 Tax=Tannerella sp. TaxID=2382127 RepID=UPI0026DADC5B|nr:YegP family protein [Tannerella sp.]MDO4704551.1 YegP family protein [Tannerella sp.]